MKKKLVKKTLIYLFIISLLVHLPLVLTPHELVPDAKVYLKSAQGLEETRNEGFVFLLKLFLLLKLNVLLMRLSLATIASLSVFTVFYSARVFVDEKKALLTTLFYVFNPFFIYYTSFLITESVYLMLMPLFIVVPYSFLRKEKHRVEDFVAVGVIAILIVLRYTLMLGYLLSVMLLLKDVFVEKAKSKNIRFLIIIDAVNEIDISSEVIKNKPPKMRANVVPTEPETSIPLEVDGILLRALPLDELVDVLEVAEFVDVVELVLNAADWVAAPIG